MYILPDATIKIYENVPFDSNYQNTCLFASASAQRSYFNGLTSKTFTKFTYQRMNRDYIQVSGIADDYQNVNYLTFQNSPTSKIYYCFVDYVQYVNVGCARLSITIDVQQTYMFDYELLDCYVEREHSVTDEIGDNIVEENLPLGELEYNYITSFPAREAGGILPQKYSIVTATTFSYTYNASVPGTLPTVIIDRTSVPLTVDGIPQGLFYQQLGDFDEAPRILKALVDEATSSNAIDGVVSIFACPSELWHGAGGDYSPYVTYKVPNHNKLPYTPKNNKLYTYPYTRLFITDLSGCDGEYRYERFKGEVSFSGTMPLQPNPVFMLIPDSYNQVIGIFSPPNYNYMLKSTALPQISYTTDSFKEWLAQNRFSLLLNGLTTTLSLASAGTPPTAATVAGMAGSAITTMTEAVRAMQLPPQLHNSAALNSLAPAGILGYQVFNQRVTEQYERIIDDYFTLYGYATNRLKVPNRNSRPHWNYVKTNWCNLEGDIPADARQQLEEIYNRGITFWKTPSEIGNYSLDNSPS